MSPLEVAACAGSALLVVSAALPCVGNARRGVTLVTLAASIAVCAAVVHWLVERKDYVARNAVSRLVTYGVEELRKATEDIPDNLIVIEGGSYSSRAIDPKLLKTELARLGYQSRVVQMSLGAANHFERYKIFSDVFERQLPPPHNEKSRHVLVLSEVQSTYDQTPLAQLTENPDTARTYDYMTPTNTWYGLRSVLDDALHDEEDAILAEEAHLVWTAARHVLINAFNVGVASRVVPMKRVKAQSGYRTGGIDKGFRFKGLSATLTAASAPIESLAGPVPRWLIDVREARLKELWGGRYSRWMYYSVPSTRRQHAEWTRTFCRVAPEPCIAVDDLALIRQLDRRSYWQDTGHVTTLGAQIYTRWLAQRLVREQALLPSAGGKALGKKPSRVTSRGPAPSKAVLAKTRATSKSKAASSAKSGTNKATSKKAAKAKLASKKRAKRKQAAKNR